MGKEKDRKGGTEERLRGRKCGGKSEHQHGRACIYNWHH